MPVRIDLKEDLEVELIAFELKSSGLLNSLNFISYKEISIINKEIIVNDDYIYKLKITKEKKK